MSAPNYKLYNYNDVNQLPKRYHHESVRSSVRVRAFLSSGWSVKVALTTVSYCSGAQTEHFTFFDRLKTPVDLQYIGGLTEPTSVAGYEAALSLKEATLAVGCDLQHMAGPIAAGVLT